MSNIFGSDLIISLNSFNQEVLVNEHQTLPIIRILFLKLFQIFLYHSHFTICADGAVSIDYKWKHSWNPNLILNVWLKFLNCLKEALTSEFPFVLTTDIGTDQTLNVLMQVVGWNYIRHWFEALIDIYWENSTTCHIESSRKQ